MKRLWAMLAALFTRGAPDGGMLTTTEAGLLADGVPLPEILRRRREPMLTASEAANRP